MVWKGKVLNIIFLPLLPSYAQTQFPGSQKFVTKGEIVVSNDTRGGCKVANMHTLSYLQLQACLSGWINFH